MVVNGFVGHWCVMSREDLHFRLRIPAQLKSQIEQAADANMRSMTAEIVARLEKSFEMEQDISRIKDAIIESNSSLSPRYQLSKSQIEDDFFTSSGRRVGMPEKIRYIINNSIQNALETVIVDYDLVDALKKKINKPLTEEQKNEIMSAPTEALAEALYYLETGHTHLALRAVRRHKDESA